MPTRSKRGSSRPKKARRKVVLIFGENENDTRTVAHLLRGLRPDGRWNVEARKRPPILIKDADVHDLPSRVDRIVAVIKAEEVTSDVIAVFAHEDCDAVEPAHLALESKILSAFAQSGYHVEAATPAWETEAWLMQWPDAFSIAVPSWTSLSIYQGRRVGLINNAKEELSRRLQSRPGSRNYRESDAPLLAAIIEREGWTRAPQAISESYSSFVAAADRVSAG